MRRPLQGRLLLLRAPALQRVGLGNGEKCKEMEVAAHSYAQDASCGSRTGGGREGFVAAYDAMADIYNFVK